MDASTAKAREYIPDWAVDAAVVYVAGMFVYATVAVEFATYFNTESIEILTQFGLTEGGIYQNMWIGGVVEPLMSKLLPILAIGLLGAVGAAIRVFIITALSGASLSLLQYLGYAVSDTFLTVFFTLGVLTVLLHHLYTEGQQLEFPKEYLQHPWLTGSLFGAVFGLLEFYWYVTDVGTEYYFRIGPLLMHVLLGGIICGTWIVLSQREEHYRNDAIAWGAVAFAIVFHVTFNSWLVHQEWYQAVWRGLGALL